MKIDEGVVQIMFQGLPVDWRSTKYIFEYYSRGRVGWFWLDQFESGALGIDWKRTGTLGNPPVTIPDPS